MMTETTGKQRARFSALILRLQGRPAEPRSEPFSWANHDLGARDEESFPWPIEVSPK